MALTAADVLDAAACYIRIVGHHKGSLCSPDGCVCANGAIIATSGYTGELRDFHAPWPPLALAASRALERYLDSLRRGWAGAGEWNDSPATTATEVIGTLHAAADAERAAMARAS